MIFEPFVAEALLGGVVGLAGPEVFGHGVEVIDEGGDGGVGVSFRGLDFGFEGGLLFFERGELSFHVGEGLGGGSGRRCSGAGNQDAGGDQTGGHK